LPNQRELNSPQGLRANQPSVSDSSQSMVAPPAEPRVSIRVERNRLLIWVAIGFLPAGLLMLALQRILGKGFSIRTELPTKAIAAFFVVLATWIVSRMEKRPLADYGIPPRQALGLRFWEGTVWGFALLSAILLVLRASGSFQIDSAALSGAALYRYAFAWAAVFYAVAINEEFAFRGYWLFFTSRRLRFWRAAAFLSLVFAAAHVPNRGENALGILHVFATGMLLCLMIRRTGTLWFAVGYHAAWDWAETFFYGTADSGLLGQGRFLNTSFHGPAWLTGGSAGPEGSVLAVVALLLCALLIHLRFPTAIYPDRPQ
jgi:uncharacterized protein